VSSQSSKFTSAIPEAVLAHLRTAATIINHNNTLGDKSPQDQGYTTAKVLVLLPTRNLCYDFILDLIESMLGDDSEMSEENFGAFISNFDRFTSEFTTPPPEPDEKEDKKERTKGSRWMKLFGSTVNSDDAFKIGFRVSHNIEACVSNYLKDGKMPKESNRPVLAFTDFYKSDLIIASPLGLKLHMEATADSDYLSSLESIYVLNADVLYMQNWAHVDEVLKACNKKMANYEKFQGDINRIRECYLEDAEFPRQVVMCGEFTNPEMVATFNNNAKSPIGAFKFKDTRGYGSVHNVPVRARHVFQRIDCESFASVQKRKLEYLKSTVLKEISNRRETGVMFYCPSYFDFIALRNVLIKMEMKYVAVTEYARWSEVQRGRSRFFHGEIPIMLYTGRMWFFHKTKIRGCKRIHFLSPPCYNEEYSEIASWIEDGGGVATSFTRYEGAEMERVVGAKGWAHIKESEKSTFVFA
jgi:U3 small nucleolar RNA-associated protein 25